MGVDMVEIDLKKTKDGHLVLMHDKTIDRTTTGKGKPEDYTLAELREFFLKGGHGQKTRHKIPTFEEVMMLCTITLKMHTPYWKKQVQQTSV